MVCVVPATLDVEVLIVAIDVDLIDVDKSELDLELMVDVSVGPEAVEAVAGKGMIDSVTDECCLLSSVLEVSPKRVVELEAWVGPVGEGVLVLEGVPSSNTIWGADGTLTRTAA